MTMLAAGVLALIQSVGPTEVQSGRTMMKLSGAGWTCDGESVTVPHTWNGTDACDGPGATVSWSGYGGGNSVGGKGYLKKRAVYKRQLPVAKPGKRYFLKCEGVSVVSEVSVNGRKVGSHVGAFTAFAFDITEFLRRDAESELELTADNRWTDVTQPMAADYSVYGGVYRDVWLIETDPICIDPVTDGADGVRVFADAQTGEVRVEVSVLGGTNEVQRFTVKSPKLWSPETPNLYACKVAIDQQGSRDAVDVRFGFRTFEFRNGLFYLNGKQRQLRGVNRHQDRAGKGWAVSAADEEQDIRLMKEMGVDALRTAHYPASRHIYDLCDEMGIIAWCEYPNVNRVTFSEEFEQGMYRQVREMVMQRFNHASIGQWSLFNELYNGESWMRPKSAQLLRMMAKTQDLILSLDKSRTVVGVMGEAGVWELNAIPQEYGLNVYPKWYSFMTMREMLDYCFAISGRKTFSISEYGVGASVKQHGDPALAVKASGMWHPEEYQAYRMHDNLLEMTREPRIWGTYVWAMFDFGADNRTEGDRHGINDKGLVTHDRAVLKDCYYMFQAAWTKTPVVYLVGQRMKEFVGDKITVMGYSNQGPVTLKVNGEVVGVKVPDEVMTVIWDSVPLVPGENRIEISAGGRTSSATWLVKTK